MRASGVPTTATIDGRNTRPPNNIQAGLPANTVPSGLSGPPVHCLLMLVWIERTDRRDNSFHAKLLKIVHKML